MFKRGHNSALQVKCKFDSASFLYAGGAGREVLEERGERSKPLCHEHLGCGSPPSGHPARIGPAMYDLARRVNPVGPPRGAQRVVRGGSFGKGFEFCRLQRRESLEPARRAADIGFRHPRRWNQVRQGAAHRAPGPPAHSSHVRHVEEDIHRQKQDHEQREGLAHRPQESPPALRALLLHVPMVRCGARTRGTGTALR